SLGLARHQRLQGREGGGTGVGTIQRGDGRGLGASALGRHRGDAPGGGVWLGTTGGLLAWNDGTARFERVPGAPEAALYSIAFDGDGVAWLAGYGELGAYTWDGGALAPLRTFGAAEGLPVVAPGGVMVDDAGVVWLTTVRGLVR